MKTKHAAWEAGHALALPCALAIVLFALVSCTSPGPAPSAILSSPEHRNLAVPSGEQLDILRYPANGTRLLLWLSSERGQAAAERLAAGELAKRGVEVWMLDLSFSYLLDAGRKGYDQIPAMDMQALLKDAGRQKHLVIYAVGRAAVPLLKAYGAWTSGEGRPDHLDFVLMHPNLYAEAEALEEARYIDFGNLQGARLRVLQPQRSAGVMWLDRQTDALRAQGAAVSNDILERLREGFWDRQEPTAYEIETGQHLADLLWGWLLQENRK